MKTLIIISMLMLTCCTREYFVFIYVQPEKKPAFGESILPTYDKSCGDPGCCVIHYDSQLIDTASFIFMLNRGDFSDHPFDTLKVKPGGAVDFSRIDIDRILKESKYKTDSILFSKP